MPKVADVVNRCDTGLVRGLSLQIIDELNLLVPNALVDFSDLFVDVAGSQINPFLQPKAKQSLALAIQERGTRLIINSAYRTVAQQYLIRRQFEAGLCSITAAAQPGFSNHEGGLALDVEDPDGWQPFFEPHGWKRLGRDFDFPHFDYRAAAGTRQDLKLLGVKAFQSLWNKHNPQDLIAVDGDFGPATAARLSQSPANGFGVPDVLILKRGDQGKEVLALQQALGLTGDAADGVFGPQTQEAVKAFQASKGLSPDGLAGPSTLAALGLRFGAQEEPPAEAVAPTQLESPEAIKSLEDLVEGKAVISLDSLTSKPDLTRQIQSRLSSIGLLQATDVDGIFGPRTKAAIEAFSRASFLDNATTGKLGPTFAKKLLDARGVPLGVRQDVDLGASTVTASGAFAKALQFTLPAEGGRVDDPFDPGGRTNKGIIQSVYNAYRRSKNLQPADVFNITDQEVSDIYFNRYWKPAQCDIMVLPLAVVQFDTAVNFGVGGAVQFLQEALGLPADGAFGPQTLGAFQANNSKALALKVIDGRIAYRHLRVAQAPSQRRFLQGWLNRDNALKRFIQPLS
jgi:lysozyme family protein